MHREACDEPECLMTPRRPWTVGHAKRDGVGLGVEGSLHSVLLCKADPAGLTAGGGRGRGVSREASDNRDYQMATPQDS